MSELLTSIISLLVGSAVFITGMNMMSGGLKKATGKGLKKIIRKTQNNGVACMGIGAAVTALIQSSAATSVMAIGFVSAGVMTVYQAVSIILGGYLGTTITGVLASLSAFSFSDYLVLLAFIGVVLMFIKKEKVKNIGEICCGLGLLFFGLSTMGDSVTGELLDGIKSLFSAIDFPLLLVIIGALFTALVQSSSATAGVVIVLLGSASAITFDTGIYLIIGATVGTVITTLIATIGSGVNAKRTGFLSLVDRVVCAIIALAVIWPVNTLCPGMLENFFMKVFDKAQFALAMFLVIYNVIFLLLAIPLVRPMEKLSFKVIKDKEESKRKSALQFIDNHLLNTPTIALMQAKREIVHMLELSFENYKRGYKRYLLGDDSEDKELLDVEEKIDYINTELSSFLIQLTNKVATSDEKKVGSYFHVINDIERIGDHAYNFYELSISMVENDLAFSTFAIEEVGKMNATIEKMFELAIMIFSNNRRDLLSELHDLENITDEMKNSLSAQHFERITKNLCKHELSPYFSNLVTELERVADHLVNVGYSIVNPTGSDE